MAQYGNFVIIQSETAVAYNHKWGALGCLYAFATGPKEATEFTSDMERVYILDSVFAEGGYLLDFDIKEAIVFGEPFYDEEIDEEGNLINSKLEEGELPYLKYIAPAWPSWKLTWNFQGVEAFAKHLSNRAIAGIGVVPRSYSIDKDPV